MKNNVEVVIAAVQQNGHALRYASDERKNNFDIVMAAVQQQEVEMELIAANDIQS